MPFNSTFCCNPFKKSGHTGCNKSLRQVQEWMLQYTKDKNITISNKICGTCRIKFSHLKKSNKSNLEEGSDINENVDTFDDIASGTEEDDIASGTEEVAISKLNQSLPYLEQSPIKKKKLHQKRYRDAKFRKISDSIQDKIFHGSAQSTSHMCPQSEIIEQLKEKFKTLTKNSEKIQLLTILPKSWAIHKIEEEFLVTNYIARKVKHLVETKGVMSTPNPKLGSPISPVTSSLVKSFYESDDVSRCMPGQKDFVSVFENGTKVRKNKRLLLGNLREMYALFKERHDGIKIGISKFCQLRPRNIILANASGSHNVCVCTKHQNVKLMIDAINLKKLTAGVPNYQLECYKDCLKQMTCIPSSSKCHLRKCNKCPGIENLKAKLNQLLEQNDIDEITYKQWVSVDRDNLETMIGQADVFVDSLCEKLEILLPHSFIAKQQAAYLSERKSNLEKNEYIAVCDFSENASFTIQDAVQGFHWNNSQATLYPIAIYFKSDGKTQHTNFIIISDCLVHDSVAVHLFHRQLNVFLRKKFKTTPKKITYFSDGSAAQFKNKKNFINLCYHMEDFGCNAEWHFFATSHGKGPSDGLGGTVKREARRASLQRPLQGQITTPKQLYEWCLQNLLNCNFEFLTLEDHEEEARFLQIRFKDLRTIPGTQKLHSIEPVDKKKIKVKRYSADADFLIEILQK